MRHFKSGLLGFFVAVCLTGSALLVRRFILIPVFDQNAPLITFTLAVVVATWISGLGSGLFATLLGAVANTYLVIESTGFRALPLTLELRPILFVIVGMLISWLVASVQSARRRIEDRQQQLEIEIAERRRAEASERQQREQLAAEMRRREKAEMALREQEERIRLAVEAADIGTWDFNPITSEQEWSSRTKAMFGLSPDADIHNLSFRDRLHPDDRQRVSEAVQRAFDPSGDGTYEIDCRLVWPDNTIHWFIAKGQAMFEGENSNRRATRFIGIALDITQRKQAEETLRQAEERFRKLATHAPVGIFQTDAQGRCLLVNDTWCAIAGGRQEDALGDGWRNFVHPEDRNRIVEEWQDATLHRRDSVAEFRFVNQEKGARWVIASATGMFDATGAISGYVGTVVDVTERKATEDLVRESESRLKGVLDNTPAAISLKDVEGRYVLVNRGWENLFGVRNDQVVGRTNYELLTKPPSHHMSQDIADQFFTVDRTVIQTGQSIEFEEILRNGEDSRILATVKFPIKGDAITGVGGISIDITERTKAIESLAAQQELLCHTIEVQDQERRLVAYEIHDGLVQYATGALMQLESMRDQVQSEAIAGQIENVVGILQRTVAEGRRLINGLRTPVLDDWGVVAALEQLIDEEDRAHVQVQFIKDESLGRMAPRIEETLYRITQEALTNIHKHSQSKKVRIELARREDRVHLEIQDWGVGFAPSNDSARRHGLKGMTERAKIAGGRCTVESAPGKGTRIAVDLPYVGRT
jgi:PAS domain S-box-containing protein